MMPFWGLGGHPGKPKTGSSIGSGLMLGSYTYQLWSNLISCLRDVKIGGIIIGLQVVETNISVSTMSKKSKYYEFNICHCDSKVPTPYKLETMDFHQIPFLIFIQSCVTLM